MKSTIFGRWLTRNAKIDSLSVEEGSNSDTQKAAHPVRGISNGSDNDHQTQINPISTKLTRTIRRDSNRLQDCGLISQMQMAQQVLQRTRHVIVRHDYFDGHDCTMAWIKE